ncbi:MAG: ketopantoate reductase family protein, partial [Deltaproteobacteria bacterium]|nr:ketopantoate reductase family protein [Deltaproteobacteria bacterium]
VNKAHVNALNKKGATITGGMNFNTPVKAVTPDRMDGIYDLVIYLAKTIHNEFAIPPVLKHMDENSAFLTLQNGLPEESVISFVGKEKTLGGTVMFAAELTGLGVSHMPMSKESMGFYIGELDGSVSARIKTIRDILTNVGWTKITSNLDTTRWDKYLFNVGQSTMCCIVDGEFLKVRNNDQAFRAMLSIIIEGAFTAKALGIKTYWTDMVVNNLKYGEDAVFKAVREFLGQHDGIPSILQDLRSGRPCEIETLNGLLIEKARKVGVATPVNDQVVNIVREIRDGKLKLGSKNLDRLRLRDLTTYIE